MNSVNFYTQINQDVASDTCCDITDLLMNMQILISIATRKSQKEYQNSTKLTTKR